MKTKLKNEIIERILSSTGSAGCDINPGSSAKTGVRSIIPASASSREELTLSLFLWDTASQFRDIIG
jgi:hypothetical protein